MSDAAFGKAHVPVGPEGSGFYSASTLGCFSVIQSAIPMVVDSIGKMDVSKPGAFAIADFGTADGGTSMPLMHEAIKTVRSKSAAKEIFLMYEDQPNNDFKSLFYYTQGHKQLTALDGPVKPLTDHEQVYIVASGTGFFHQTFPSDSVDLSVSFTAMHWLSRLPCHISTGIHSTQATGEEKDKFMAQAAKDFETILLARAAELKKGGYMVIANFAVDNNQHWLGKSDIGPCMYDTMDRLWKGMSQEGLITEEEYRRTTFCNHYRTEPEMLAPFKEGTAVYSAGLRLVDHSFKLTRCPFRAAYLERGGDPVAHAAWIVNTFRTWSNSTFESALDESRREAERRKLSDELFKRFEGEIAKDPKGYGMDYVHSFLVVRKE